MNGNVLGKNRGGGEQGAQTRIIENKMAQCDILLHRERGKPPASAQALQAPGIQRDATSHVSTPHRTQEASRSNQTLSHISLSASRSSKTGERQSVMADDMVVLIALLILTVWIPVAIGVCLFLQTLDVHYTIMLDHKRKEFELELEQRRSR